jgi:hypothetical protein
MGVEHTLGMAEMAREGLTVVAVADHPVAGPA